MTKRTHNAALLLVGILLVAAAPARPAPPPPPRHILAHYMPWFTSDPFHKNWGWHWTMGHYNPEHVVSGRADAASRYRPLIGLYDSGDPDVLEYQVLQMKFAGIDGLVIDWYGTDDYLDYVTNHRNALRLIPLLKKAGLQFAVMYEEQTVPKLLAAHRLPNDDRLAHGKAVLGWLGANWFADPAYLKRNSRPVFMVFGSGYYTGGEWSRIFAPPTLAAPPCFYTEADSRPPAVGGFDWPHPSGGTEAALRAQDEFYGRVKLWSDFVPVAFPRFEDVYADAGVHASWGSIADKDGSTYKHTLERALQSGADLIQIATWNDWGEGTMIEPSVEFGYRDLEATQTLRCHYLDPTFAYTAADLRLPIALFGLRKRYHGDTAKTTQLDRVSALLFAGRTKKARAALARF